MKKVLILGASGLLGRYVSIELAATGFAVHVQSRNSGHACDQVFDPTHRKAFHVALTKLRPDVVVNVAALTNVDYCEEHLDEAFRVNTGIAESLAAWVPENHPDCHVIQISTDQVYARPGFQREADVDMLNVYALTKYAAELALRELPNLAVLRTNFFGRSLTQGRHSFSDWIHHSLLHSIPIRLATDIEFNPLSLGSLARTISAVAGRKVTGVFNAGARTALSKHAFGLRFAQAVSLRANGITACTAAELGFRVPRPLDMRMDVGRISGVQGAMPTLEDEIERSATAYSTGGNG